MITSNKLMDAISVRMKIRKLIFFGMAFCWLMFFAVFFMYMHESEHIGTSDEFLQEELTTMDNFRMKKENSLMVESMVFFPSVALLLFLVDLFVFRCPKCGGILLGWNFNPKYCQKCGFKLVK